MPPDREHDDGLERELRELGGRVDYPPTPDLARTVRDRLDPQPARRRGAGRLRALATSGWAAAAAVVFLFASAVVLSATLPFSDFSVSSGGAGGAAGGAGAPSAQYAPEDGGQDGAAAGGAASAGAGSSTASTSGASLGLGGRISASEARARVGTLLLPETPELASEPTTIYAGGPSGTEGAVLVYPARPGLPPLGDAGVGLVLAEAPGDLRSSYPAVFRTESRSEEVEVGGSRGYWFPDGRDLRSQPGDVENLPGGALLWEKGDVSLLLRARATKDEAIRIAESVV